MNIKSIEIKDTNGSLSKDVWKTTINESSVTPVFDDSDDNKRIIKLSPGNVNFVTVGGRGNTYKSYLTYNGTLSTKDQLYKRVVAEDVGAMVGTTAPVLTYSPNNSIMPSKEDMQNELIQLNISMHTGVADVLEYREGSLTRGEKSYKVKAIHNYPMTITEMPNMEKDVVFLDGWYTYTFVMFRDVISNVTRAEKGLYYASKGTMFKASKSGLVIVQSDGSVYILYDEFVLEDGLEDNVDFREVVGAELQADGGDYLDLRMQLDARDGVGDNYNHSYVESQVLITDEIRDAITREIMCSLCTDDTGCTFADWQRLTLKRQAAFIMFENGLYRNSQTLIESSRKLCHSKYKDEC